MKRLGPWVSNHVPTRRKNRRRQRTKAGNRLAYSAFERGLRSICHEPLEERVLLASDFQFAVAGPNGGQDFAVATDPAGNVYVLGTDAVYKYTATGAQIWATSYTAFSGINQKEGLAVDSAGNVYITGNFSTSSNSTAKFGSVSLTSAGGSDGYVAKLDTNGNFLWAQAFGGTGGDAGYGVAVDASDNVFVTGDFSDTATFGQGAVSVTLQSAGGTDAFVAKFNSSGALDWAHGIGGTGFDQGRGVAVDSQGDVYLTGQFSGTVDFDPAQAAVHDLKTFFGAAYILKLDGNGDYLWAKELNGTNLPQGDGRSVGQAITVDSAGNVYATGIFGGPVNLDPSGGTDIVQADFVFPDAFVLKLGATGGFDWAADLHNVSGANPFGGFNASGIAVDARGNVYTTGNFQGVADFDPGANADNRLSAGGVDAYVSALDSQGHYAWAAVAGESGSDFGWGIAATAAGNLYVAGSFSNTIDFDPGPNVKNVTAQGLWDGFVWGLNYPPQAIYGVAWNDQNQDGVRESDEPGLPGTSIALYQGTPGNGVEVATTTADALGLYSFKGLKSGVSYYIQVSVPAGETLTTQNAGSDPTLSSSVSPTTARSAAITLGAGQTAIANAGFKATGATPSFGLAFGIVTSGFTEGSSIIADAAGNFYVAGSFDGFDTVFGSGPGAVKLTTGANNDFVAKYSHNGTLLWVRQAVSSYWQYGPKLQLDAFGDVYVAGSMTGKTTFGSTVIDVSTDTAFLWKLDSQGNTLWAKAVVSKAAGHSVDMALDSGGNAYVVGAFSGTYTVDTSPSATTLAAVGSDDIFIVKYDASGAPLWAKSFGASGKYDGADSVAVDPSGNPIITGSFAGTLQLGTQTISGGSQGNAFVAKFNASDGSAVWAHALVSSVSSGSSPLGLTTPLNRIAIDSNGNVYTTGVFNGKLQLDPTSSSDLTAYGYNATYISKLDDNGKFVWGKAFLPGTGGYDVNGYGIAVDSQDNVYTTGTFARKLNFNPDGTPAADLTAIGASYDIYISKLDKDGNYISAQQFGGSGEDEGTAIYVDGSGNLYATGLSYGPANFSPTSDVYNVGAKNEQDIFVLRLNGASASSFVNSAPSFAFAGPTQKISQNAGPQTAPGFIANIVSGPAWESNEALKLTVSNNNPALFTSQPSIDLATGTLTYAPAANNSGIAQVTITLSNNGGTADGGSDTFSQSFTIDVGALNSPPSFTPGPDESVGENGGPQTFANWATNISDGLNESGQTLNFLVSNDNNALFAVQPSIDPSGALTFTPATNAIGTATVTVQLHDNGGTAGGGVDTSAPVTFTITVFAVNQPPSFTLGPQQTVLEDSGSQSVTDWATNMNDGANETGQTLTFLVSNNNNALFSVQPSIDAAGTLTYTPAPNAHGTATVTVQLQDDGGTANGGVDTSAPQTFAITLTPVNDAPSFTPGTDQTAFENAGPQSVANWATNLSAGPNEASQTLDFLVSNDKNALFAAQPAIDSSGKLTYTPATNAFGTATVTVQLHDDGGTDNGGVDVSGSVTFTITVNAVNQPPRFTSGPQQTVWEDAGPQTVNAWATNIDDGPNETGQTLDFQISNDNNSLFSAQPAIDLAGNLTYTPAANAYGTATVTVLLHDDGGTANGGVDTSAAQTFTITVTPVNDAPSFTPGADQATFENTGPQAVNAWATNLDAGPNETGQTLTFLLSNDDNALFSTQPAIDPTGKLTYAPAANMSGTATVTVLLQDDGGTANGGVNESAPATFTITITPVNQPPSFTAGANQTVWEDAGPQTVPAWAANVSDGPNETGQTLNFVVSSDNQSLFSAQPTIDSSGTLRYTPAANAYGTATITVRLHDDAGTANGGIDTSASQKFTISVRSVNDPPEFTAGPNQTVLEDAGPQVTPLWATNINDGPNETAQTLTFRLSNDNNALFSVQPTVNLTGRLSYTPAANAYGTATVTVELQDNGGTANGGVDTTSKTFTITVTPVNDAPSFAIGGDQTVLEDSGAQTVNAWATNITAGPNEGNQTLNFVVSSDNQSLFSAQPTIDSSGTLSYTPAPNAYGTAIVTVQLQDDGGTANGGVNVFTQTFAITVTAINDAPTFTSGGDQTVNEDAGPQTVAGWASNISDGPMESGQTLNFSVTTDNLKLFAVAPSIDANTGALTYTPADHLYGQATVTVQLHDNGGTANGGVDVSTQTFVITVNFVNQAPTFAAGADQTVKENAGPQTVPGWASNISQGVYDPPQTLEFTVSSDNPSLFSAAPAIDVRTGTLTYTPAPDQSGQATVTATLQDDGGTANGGDDATSKTFTITVNQAPQFTAGDNVSVAEDSSAKTVANWATGISISPNVQPQTSHFVVTTDDPGLFSVAPAIDSSGTLTFTPGLHKQGTANVSVKLEDSQGDASATQTFKIELTPVNHAPTVAAPVADQTLNENAADAVFSVANVFDDIDVPYGDNLTLSVASNDNPTLLDASVAGGMLKLHLNPDQYGTAHIDLQATDDGGKYVDDKFTVNVNMVNQAPSFTPGPDQRVAPGSGPAVLSNWATNISAGAVNEAGQTLHFQVTGNSNPGLFSTQPMVDATTGDLRFTPAAGASGTAAITLELKDNGGTANGGVNTSAPATFHITLNNAPVAQPDTFVLSDNASSTTAAGAGVLSNDADANGDALTATLVSGPQFGTLTLNADGSFTYVKGANFAGVDTFTYKASDGMADSGTATVRVLSYQASIVEKLYQQVLHRSPDDGGLTYWAGRLQNGESAGVIAQGIFESNERLDPIIVQYYQEYLLRTADAAGVAYWRSIWKRDGGPENVIAGMISSQEFFQSAGGTNAAWIQTLYQRLLNRPADQQGLHFWTQQLDLGLATKQQVVLRFTQSTENFQNLVTGFYQEYLQRAPTSDELNIFVQQMQAGASQRDIQIDIIGSDEYRNSPPPPAPGAISRFSL